MSSGLELLTTAEMAEADRLAVAAGVPFLTLMENAGRAVADEATDMVQRGARVVVLCGPGNNGGDGFVAARLLSARQREVTLALLGNRDALKGDAAAMAAAWAGRIEPLSPEILKGADLIVDALFGSGLTRPLAGAAADIVAACNLSGVPILAVDVPSGLDGATGAPTGPVIEATRTITFFCRKLGHVLMPGRRLSGRVVVADIGIPGRVLDVIKPSVSANAPPLWLGSFPQARADAHKYARGHAVAVSGPPESTGAARLGARGALRAGAGLVSVASPQTAFAVNAAHLTAIMVKPFAAPEGLAEILKDKRLNAVLLGPGGSVGPTMRRMVEIVLASGAAVVLDADAVTSYAAEPATQQTIGGGVGFLKAAEAAPVAPQTVFAAIKAMPGRQVVLTPHEGEFKRLFPGLAGSKLDRARAAAERSGAVVILKGPDTVIAAPPSSVSDGRAAINDSAPPALATAGSGDVLAGFVTGLIAQGMPAFEAACAAVWLHGECANQFGPGLIAEDIAEMLPKVLRELDDKQRARAAAKS